MPALAQLEIRYEPPVEPPAPAASIEGVERVVSVLSSGEWMTALEIASHLGMPETENSKRKIRAVAEATRPGILSYPNSSGYKLAKLCTQAEWDACLSAWASFRRKISQTEALYLTGYHGRGHTS